MPKPLVVVESPAKAKTLSKFLGNDFDVRASVGHVADLPSKGLNIDVDNGFKPTYELTERAIAQAENTPRALDSGWAAAAETRRILDRLYGYEVSPVLWRRVNRGLSAGRVQSPAVRLVVQRERERMAFVSAGYWDIELTTATAPSFTADLVAVDGTRVATGKDFDSRGQTTGTVVVLDEPDARTLADRLDGAEFTVRSVEEKPYKSSPRPPFMTSTLQQEGGRKLRLSSSQVMRVAQSLYERGYITYMRTDSVTLSAEALQAVRAAITAEYGPQSLAPTPRQYSSKV